MHPTRKWWNQTSTIDSTQGTTRTEIQNLRGIRCPNNTNQYEEKADLDLKKTCLTTNPKYFLGDKIINFKETGDGSTEYDPMDGVTIRSNVDQDPSPRLKNPGTKYGDDPSNPKEPMKKLSINNNFATGYESFNSLADFYRFQVCKKMDKNQTQKQKFLHNPEFDKNPVTKMYLNDVNFGTRTRQGVKKKISYYR